MVHFQDIDEVSLSSSLALYLRVHNAYFLSFNFSFNCRFSLCCYIAKLGDLGNTKRETLHRCGKEEPKSGHFLGLNEGRER